MSEADDELAGRGRHALRTARVDGLRRRMNEYLEDHDRNETLDELRMGAPTGKPMSELVDEDRWERV